MECESARWGRAGISLFEALPLEDRDADIVADRLSEEAVSKNPLRWAGSGETGDDSTDEVSGVVAGVLRKLLLMDEKSESSAERKEAFDEALDMDRISGALRA